MEKNKLYYDDHSSMVALTFLLLYLVFSYIFISWTRTMSTSVITRETFSVNLIMYLLPCFMVISMIFFEDSSLQELGIGKKSIAIISGMLLISLMFYKETDVLKLVLIVISEGVIFRCYAGERLKGSFGTIGSILITGVFLGFLYTVVPFVNHGITLNSFGLYICLGIITQSILQLVLEQFGKFYITLILHLGVLVIAF